MALDTVESGNFTNMTDGDSPATVTGTITPAAGDFVRIPAHLASDPIITMANTIDITLFWSN